MDKRDDVKNKNCTEAGLRSIVHEIVVYTSE